MANFIVIDFAIDLPKLEHFKQMNYKHYNFHIILSIKPFMKKFLPRKTIQQEYQQLLGHDNFTLYFYSVPNLFKNEQLYKVTKQIQNKVNTIDGVISFHSDSASYAGFVIRDFLKIQTHDFCDTTYERMSTHEMKTLLDQHQVSYRGIVEKSNLSKLVKKTCLDSYTYDKFFDKLMMKQAIGNVPTAEFIPFDQTQQKDDVDDFVKRVGFPLMLKKRKSAGSKGVSKINNIQEYHQVCKQIKHKDKYILEKYIEGLIVRLNGRVKNGVIDLFIPSVHHTSPFDFYNYGQPRISSQKYIQEIGYNRLLQFSQDIVNKLKMIHSIFHHEVIWNQKTNKLYFMETTIRPGGGMVDYIYESMYNFNQKKHFYDLQFYQGTFDKIFNYAYDSNDFKHPKEHYAIILYPYLTGSKYSFQEIKFSKTMSEIMESKKYQTLNHFILNKNINPNMKLTNRKFFYPYETFNPIISCYFKGSIKDIENELNLFQEEFQVIVKAKNKFLNTFIPRQLLTAGSL